MLVWAGSVLAVVAAAALSIWSVGGLDRVLVVGAALIYVREANSREADRHMRRSRL